MDSRSLSQEAVPTMTNNNNNKRRNNKGAGKQSFPIAYSPRLGASMPLNSQSVFNGKDIIVDDVTITSNFSTSSYLLNPRLPTMLSAQHMAKRYDRYVFESLEFRWHPTSAMTTTPGVVFLAWEPNANRDEPTSVAQINAFKYHTEGPVYNPSIVLRIPKSALGGFRYMREGPTMSDLNLYDTGRLVVAANSGAPLSNGGFVEVSYRVKMIDYHLESGTPVQNRMAVCWNTSNTNLTTTGAPTILPLEATPEDMNDEFESALASNVITLPYGRYLVTAVVNWTNGGGAVDNPTLYIYKNATAVSSDRHSIMNTETGQHRCEAVISSTGTDTVSLYYLIAVQPYTYTANAIKVFITALS